MGNLLTRFKATLNSLADDLGLTAWFSDIHPKSKWLTYSSIDRRSHTDNHLLAISHCAGRQSGYRLSS